MNKFLRKLVGFSFVYFLAIGSVLGQHRNIHGVVTDTKKETLSYITVMAKPVDKTKAMKFAMTDDLGQYIVDLELNTSYVIEFTSMGFETFSFTYLVEKLDLRKDVQLTEKVNQLQTVVIDIPIVVKKDTVIYKTDQFITGEERTLKDVLEKLPGIEVDDEGNVTSNGNKITHMLVENKKFFGGNSKLAVENIPADAIHRVEVIDDYNEVAFLKGMHKSDKMAMNIKLKEGKKNFLFGNIEAGKGNKEYYKTHANLFYYRPDININFIGGMNNAGKKTLSMSDYQNFIGTSSSVFKARDIDQEKVGISEFIESTDVVKTNQKVGAFNLSKSVNKKLEISSYFILSSSTNSQLQESINQYLIPDNNYTEVVDNIGEMDKHFGIGNLTVDYKLSGMEEIILKVLGKKSVQEGVKLLRSTIDDATRVFDENSNTTNYYTNANLEWHKKTAKKHAFSFSAIATQSNHDFSGFWHTNQAFLSDLLPLVAEDIYKLNYLRNKKKNNLQMVFKHYWTISQDNFLHFTVGNNYRKEQFFTNDKQILADASENEFDGAGFNNDVTFELNDFYAGIHSDFRIGKYEFAQSVFAHNYQWTIAQLNSVTVHKWIFLPDFQIKADYRSFGKVRLKYQMTNGFTEVSKLANRFYLKSYNSVYKGNENLKNALTNSYSLRYSKSNVFKRLLFIASLNYKEKLNGIINYAVTEGSDNYLTSIMADAIYKGWSGNILISKWYRSFKLFLNTDFSNSTSLSNINNQFVENINTNGGYSIRLSSNFEKIPRIQLSFRQSFGKNTSVAGDYNYRIENPSVKIDYDFFKSYIFSMNYLYYRYKNRTYNNLNTYSLAGMKLIYDNKDTHWGASLSVENLFDAKYKNQNNYNTYITSDIKTYILPRVMMLTLMYKL
ncbi:hypothetical protein [Flavicella sp.]|uniref:TonB-dependent receptor n=1 Tax=Flavicella sp. TaxID=2957742 RepID=UPI003015A95A